MRSYSRIARALHWVTAAAVALEIGLGWRNVSEPALFPGVHETIGYGILAITLARIAWRVVARGTFPEAPTTAAQWQRWSARVVHAAFYVLLVSLPVSGWIGAERIHRQSGYALFALLLLHILGALRHHFQEPASGFSAMLPGVRRVLDWRIATVSAGLCILVLSGSGVVDQLLPRWPGAAASGTRELRAIDARRTPVFAGVVQPILAANCVSCHGPQKQKGELRLDSLAFLAKGGSNGKIVVPGSAAASELVRRVLLPLDDEHAMPPSGRNALSIADGQLLIWWIETGASGDATIAASHAPPLVQSILKRRGVTTQSPVFAARVAEAPQAALAAAAAGFNVRRAWQQSNLLEAAVSGSSLRTPDLTSLAPLRQQLLWLDLAGAAIQDDDLETLQGFVHLQRLNLARTPISDLGLRHLVGLPSLEVLNLYGTGLTDASVGVLGRMKSLLTVYVGDTPITEAAVQRLRASRPALAVHAAAEGPR